MTAINSYRDLDVWQRSIDLAVKIYAITAGFPGSELYGLTNQIRRFVVSVASNVAEGHSRSTKDFVRFLFIAKGSHLELETQLEIARRVGISKSEESEEFSPKITIIGKQLNTLISRLKDQVGT